MDYKVRCKIYDEFSLYLNTLGIPAVSIEYYDTNYISIYVQKISDIQDSKEIAERHSEEIISSFKNFLKLYNYEGNYNKYKWDSSCVTNIYSKDAKYIDNLIRKSKKEIIEQINIKISPDLRPMYVFCYSSTYEHGYFPAGYSIVFDNEIDLKKSEQIAQKQIIDLCNEILCKNDTENKYEFQYIKVGFYNAKNCNLHEMSRED